MDKMEVVRDEVSGFLVSTSKSASDHLSCSELPAHGSSLYGYTKLLRAGWLDKGVEQGGCG